jgi:hypothetical protein
MPLSRTRHHNQCTQNRLQLLQTPSTLNISLKGGSYTGIIKPHCSPYTLLVPLGIQGPPSFSHTQHEFSSKYLYVIQRYNEMQHACYFLDQRTLSKCHNNPPSSTSPLTDEYFPARQMEHVDESLAPASGNVTSQSQTTPVPACKRWPLTGPWSAAGSRACQTGLP